MNYHLIVESWVCVAYIMHQQLCMVSKQLDMVSRKWRMIFNIFVITHQAVRQLHLPVNKFTDRVIQRLKMTRQTANDLNKVDHS